MADRAQSKLDISRLGVGRWEPARLALELTAKGTKYYKDEALN
jgi:hypothetical protein